MSKASIATIILLLIICCQNHSKTNNQQTLEEVKTKTDSGYIQSGQTKIFYKTIGEGRPILFLHGGPGGYLAHDYPYFKALSKDYKLIFYDQRGTGKSKAEITKEEINIKNFINDISTICDSLNIEKVNLVGVSWGGLLSMIYTLKHPEKVNKVALIGTAGLEESFLDDMTQNLNKRITKSDRQEIKQYQSQINDSNKLDLTEKIGMVFYKSYVKNKKSLVGFKPNMDLNTVQNQTAVNRLIWSELNKADFNYYHDLKNLANEVLILRREFDPIPKVYSEKIVSNAKNAKMIDFSNSGHMPHIEENQKTLNLIKTFLSKK